MPFDFAAQRPTIAAALDGLGVSAVSKDVLVAHMTAEAALYPPSFWWRHRRLLRRWVRHAPDWGAAALLAGIIVVGWQFYTEGDPGVTVAVGMVAVLLTALALWLTVDRGCSIHLRAPARWRERRLDDAAALDAFAVPSPIRELADAIEARCPGVGFRYGELVQKREVLDPFLIAETADERVVLGIWKGDHILAMADKRARPPLTAAPTPSSRPLSSAAR